MSTRISTYIGALMITVIGSMATMLIVRTATTVEPYDLAAYEAASSSIRYSGGASAR